MADDITLPGVGTIPKKVLIAVGVGAVSFVGWKYWQARQTSTAADTTVTDGDFGAVDSSIPGVVGAVSPTNSYGGDTGDTGSTGVSKTTDSQWTADVVTAFATAGSTVSGDDVLQALGLYLANKPMTTAQQSIVQRAIAVAGYPYGTGAHTIVSGGNTALTVAPANLKVTALGPRSATIAFTAVPGATEYRAYRGVGVNVAATHASPIIVAGLTANTKYTVTIQGLTASGIYSPSSKPIVFTTHKS
jgi:hypothetical protein